MKALILTSFLFFTQQTLAKNCLLINGDTPLCTKADETNLYYFQCNETVVCYTGNQKDVIHMINARTFDSSEMGISEAKKLNSTEIQFTFGDVGSVCNFSAKKCD